MELLLENLLPLVIILSVVVAFGRRLLRVLRDQVNSREKQRAREAAERRTAYRQRSAERATRRPEVPSPPRTFTYDTALEEGRQAVSEEEAPAPERPAGATSRGQEGAAGDRRSGEPVESGAAAGTRRVGRSGRASIPSLGEEQELDQLNRVRNRLRTRREVAATFVAMELLRSPVSLRMEDDV